MNVITVITLNDIAALQHIALKLAYSRPTLGSANHLYIEYTPAQSSDWPHPQELGHVMAKSLILRRPS